MQRVIMKDIQKKIKGKIILRSANLLINKGEICALVGPNGVGKTTLIKCLLGLINPDVGTINVNGKTLIGADRTVVLSQLGAVLQFPNNISDMTIEQIFIEHYQYLNLVTDMEKIRDLLKKVELKVDINAKIGTLSLGMKQRLLFALAIAHKPNIIVLDEPFNGLDIDGIVLIKNILNTLIKEDVAVLIASHSLAELENIATSIVFMMDGETYEKQSVNEIMKSYSGGLLEYYQFFKNTRGGNR